MKIDKHIPIPKGFIDYAKEMEVGDSVLFETLSKSRSLTRALLEVGFQYTGSAVEDGYRIWRTA